MAEHPRPAPPTSISREIEEAIRRAVATVRFGTVTLVIQDGRVIQLDKSEKIRLT